ncbi:MAG: HDOD domain-containing protein [Solirubrobacteraceae bacterium]
MSLAVPRDDDLASGPPRPEIVSPAPRLSPAPRRILFVDDRPETFEGLREAMRSSGSAWEVEFAGGGDEALAALAERPADVLVAEENMALMDGVTLLTRVRDRHPTTIRMILSASSRPGMGAIVSHRLLSKPCNVAELGVLIKRSCALHQRTREAEAFRRTMATTALPSRPGVYMELNQVLGDPTWQPSQVSAVIERDVALSAKVLQLANSALFGLTSTVSTVRDAVVYLGGDTIRSLALTAEAFGRLTPRTSEGFSIDAFQAHAMLVARITASILPAGRAQQEAVTAALLHDIGRLVLIADGGARLKQLNERARALGVPVHVIEQQGEGVSHAEIGAHLLSLWGLPDGIVEAVASHHNPSSVPGLSFDGVIAVHIADALANEFEPRGPQAAPRATLDAELIERLGLGPRVDLWRHVARQLVDADADPR